MRPQSLARLERRHLGMAYLLWALGLVGVCGLQRFYNRKPLSGTLYLLTFGLCFLGQLVDLLLMPELVEQANVVPALRGSGTSAEIQLLQLARRSGERGFTLNDAVLEVQPQGGLESEQLRREIEKLLHAHLLDVGNDERGRVVYREP
ncbi:MULTISPECIES: TM2 domain-containing protein [Aphanothece]|uniref:TM2 domain-containing protein n=1 Tax=Aphanothece TaxID=1121 RepID=UPI003984E8F0